MVSMVKTTVPKEGTHVTPEVAAKRAAELKRVRYHVISLRKAYL